MLNDKKIVVIGGSSGIGFGVAQAALAQGAELILASRSEDKLQAAKAKLKSDKVSIHSVDMRDMVSLEALFKTIGQFDHLVISGAELTFNPFEKQYLEADRANFESKFWGPYQSVMAAIPGINKGGSVTFFSGILSRHPRKNATNVSAINNAIEGLSRGLAVDFPTIRFNTIAPGLTHTAAAEALSEEVIEGLIAGAVMHRMAEVDEIARGVLYLMQSTYTTGTTLFVDGGIVFN